ncbi:MAG: hypothetical protein RL230_2110, partial [Pseudomonadota bacterium]
IGAGRGAYLDCRSAIGAGFPDHFPTVFAACAAAGLDPRNDLIPIAPAAHYHMGGIVTDVWGKTTLDGLSAIGECASTGVHGANRLASNSLLEAVVFAHRVAERLRDAPSGGQTGGDAATIAPLPAVALQVLRTEMTAKAGVVRDATGLTSLIGTIHDLKAQHGSTNELVTAGLIAEGALARKESRGGHYRSDFPKQLDPAKRSFATLEPQS